MEISRISKNIMAGMLGGVLTALLFASSASGFASQDDKKKDKSSNASHSQGSGSSGGSHQPNSGSQPPSGGGGASSSGQGGSASGGHQSGQGSPGQGAQGGSGSQTAHGAQTSNTGQGGAGGGNSGQHYGQQNAGQGTQSGSGNPGGAGSGSGQHHGQQNAGQGAQSGSGNQGGAGSGSGQHYGQQNAGQGTQSGYGNQGGAGSGSGQHYGQQSAGQGAQSQSGNHGAPPNYGSHQAGGYNQGGGPRHEFHGANGSSARFDNSGHPVVVHIHDTTIIHVPGGLRRVEVVRPGGVVIVSHSPHYGYVQRPVVIRGYSFVQRSYYVNGATYTRVYRPWIYGGITYNVYTPISFYHPSFYLWIGSPWRTPVYYGWGWMNDPWYRSYDYYFTPYATYYSPSLWLTDYVIAATLREGYQAQMAASPAGYDGSLYAARPVPMSPGVKNQVNDEVQRQLAMERLEATEGYMPSTGGVPPILSGEHIFLVSDPLLVTASSGEECELTSADVLRFNRTIAPDPSFANVQVMASKRRDCAPGMMVAVQLADLQEMHNHMRARLDQGLAEMQGQQGQRGLPPIEASMRVQTPAAYASALPPPDPAVSTEVQQGAQDADRQEQQVLSQASSEQPQQNGTPPTITLGQTMDEVVQMLGTPSKIIDLGQKKTYVYSDMKVVFTDGRVSDVQ